MIAGLWSAGESSSRKLRKGFSNSKGHIRHGIHKHVEYLNSASTLQQCCVHALAISVSFIKPVALVRSPNHWPSTSLTFSRDVAHHPPLHKSDNRHPQRTLNAHA